MYSEQCISLNELLVWSASDENECLTNNGGCAQICNNTVGSLTCSCNTGYSIGADARSCAGKRTQCIT